MKHVKLGRKYRLVYAPSHLRAHIDGYVYEHLIIAGKALGRHIPIEVEIHHINGDGFDNSRSNLIICENKKYHQLLHARQRVISAGGDPNTQKVCSKCLAPKEFGAFYADKRKFDGLNKTCRLCTKLRLKATYYLLRAGVSS